MGFKRSKTREPSSTPTAPRPACQRYPQGTKVTHQGQVGEVVAYWPHQVGWWYFPEARYQVMFPHGLTYVAETDLEFPRGN